MTKRQLLKKLRLALAEAAEHKPFVGVAKKDYYRGQWDAIAYVIEDLLKSDLYTKKELDKQD